MRKELRMISFCFVFLFLMLVKMNVGAEEINFKEKEFELLSCERLDNGLICRTYAEQQNISMRSQSRGYTYYVTYEKASSGAAVCQLKITVSFTYNNSSGNAVINYQTYSIVGLYNGYSVKNFRNSFVNGNPAVAKLLFTIYNENETYNVSPRAYCYNNGSASNSK